MLLSIVGLQWGDEGKGKIVDYLSEHADLVVRFQGGHNAGHTIVVGENTYKLSLLPSNILRDDKKSIIGSGVVIDPEHLLKEIAEIEKSGFSITPDKLMIAENACLILPIHKILDGISENLRDGEKIGTTKRGIGPAYADKVARRAIRICDLYDQKLVEKKVKELLNFYGPILSKSGTELLSETVLNKEINAYAEKLLSYAQPVWRVLQQAQQEQKIILYEGAQGVMLDIDHGTYPFVTSSNTVTGQVFNGSGLGVQNIDYNIGIVKAYTTRVGEGPFPTELFDDTGKLLQEKGHEFGTVTGRDRRCGWLDLVQLKQMVQICGINSIVLTKLDVLGSLPTLKLCTSYQINDETFDYLPATQHLQKIAQPNLIEMPGWQSDICDITDYAKLPENAQKYISFIEEYLGVAIDIVSTGPERNSTILRKDYFSL